MSKTLKYITFRLSDDKKEIVVDGRSSNPDYEEFLKQLPENDCRWAVYDFAYKLEDGSQRNKLCFFSW
jgi:cofilin